jgi:hypothetical protein
MGLSSSDVVIHGFFHSIQRFMQQRPLTAEIKTHKSGPAKFDPVLQPHSGVFKKPDWIRQISGAQIDPG